MQFLFPSREGLRSALGKRRGNKGQNPPDSVCFASGHLVGLCKLGGGLRTRYLTSLHLTSFSFRKGIKIILLLHRVVRIN